MNIGEPWNFIERELGDCDAYRKWVWPAMGDDAGKLRVFGKTLTAEEIAAGGGLQKMVANEMANEMAKREARDRKDEVERGQRRQRRAKIERECVKHWPKSGRSARAMCGEYAKQYAKAMTIESITCRSCMLAITAITKRWRAKPQPPLH